MSVCPRCASKFICAMADNIGEQCWCTALPPIAFRKLPDGELKADASCFCPQCLPVWKAEQEARYNANLAIQLP